MKKRSLNKVFAMSATLSLLLPCVSYAGIQGVRTAGGASSSGSVSSGGTLGTSGTVVAGKVTPIDEKSTPRDVNSGTVCSMDQNISTNFPMDFLNQISRDGQLPTFEMREGNTVMVKFPPIITTCGKVTIKPQQDPKTKNVTVSFSMEKNGVDQTYGQVIDCLSKVEGDKKPMLENGKIDHDKIPSSNYSEYFYTFNYDFDKVKDIKNTVKLSVGYPKAFSGSEGYGSTYGKDTSVELPSSTCMEAEKVASNITYLNKGRDALLAEFKTECTSRDAQRISEARKSIGNAEALKDIADVLKSKLDAAYLIAVKSDVDNIYAAMTKIENEINTNKELDEATAKKKAKAYADLAKQLDEKFLNPAIFRLDNLMKEYADASDEEVKSKISDEIKKLNEDIAGFAKRNSTSMINLYGMMEKFAINDSAKTIEDIRLKSYLYSKVYPGGNASDLRGKAISIVDANLKQVKGISNFERTLNDWSDVYLVGQGSMVPIRKTEQERSRTIAKMNTRWGQYQQNEYKQYYQYCGTGMTGGVKNPIQCNTFIKGVEKRRNIELRKRDRDLSYVRARDEKLNKMGVVYNNYQTAQMEKEQRDEDDAPYGASYSGYETTFSEKFPQYDGPSTSTSYDSWRYNMGGQDQQMFGQQQQYAPQNGMAMQGQQNYMMAPGQYQYQMPMTYN